MSLTKNQSAALFIEAHRLYQAWRSEAFPPIRIENGPMVTTGRSTVRAFDEFCDFLETCDWSLADVYKAADAADYWHRVPGHEDAARQARAQASEGETANGE